MKSSIIIAIFLVFVVSPVLSAPEIKPVTSAKDTFQEEGLKVGKKTCSCSFSFLVVNDKVHKSSKASCDSKCSGTVKQMKLTNYTTGNTFTFRMKVSKGLVKLKKPKFEVQIQPGRAEDGFFEGDMKLNADQLEMMKAALINGSLDGIKASPGSEPSGNAVIGNRYRWPANTVRYQLDYYLSSSEKNLVRTTLRSLEKKMDSCLRFVESSSGNRIYVKNNGGGCSSRVGYQGQPTQELYLQSGGCMYPGIIEHEFLHAIGIYHHQSRSDRDSYVRIIWGNIEAGKENNFNKYSSSMVTHYNIPYDYTSVMHYGGTDFGYGRMTIQTLDSSKQNVIGQREGVSASDVELVKRMYDCGAPTTTSRPASTTGSPTCKKDIYDVCSNFKDAGYCQTGDSEIDAWMEENCYKSCVGCLEAYSYHLVGGPIDDDGSWEWGGNWITARETCNKMGLSLLEIGSQEEQDYYKEWSEARGLRVVAFWHGARRLAGSTFWEGQDGNSLTYTHWGSGQPDGNLYTAQCAVGNGGEWWDDPCSGTYKRIVCEKKNV